MKLIFEVVIDIGIKKQARIAPTPSPSIK